MTQERLFALGSSYALAFAPDESALFVVAARVQRWDLSTGKRTHSVAWAHGSDLDVSPDGSRVVVTNTSGDVAMFDASTMEQLWVARGREFGEGPGPLFSADGEAFVTASWSGHLVVRASADGEILLQEHDQRRRIYRLACSPERTWIAIGSNSDQGPQTHVRRWPLAAHRAEAVAFGESARAMALDSSGRLAIGGYGTFTVLDLRAGVVLAQRAGGSISRAAVAWSPDGELAVIEDDAISGFAGDTLAPRWSIPASFACAAAYSPSGTLLALGGWKQGEVLRRAGAGPAADE